jgi:hypothetical protein
MATKLVKYSVDYAEWHRYYREVEVDSSLTGDALREAIEEKDLDGEYRDCGTACLGNVEFASSHTNYPED